MLVLTGISFGTVDHSFIDIFFFLLCWTGRIFDLDIFCFIAFLTFGFVARCPQAVAATKGQNSYVVCEDLTLAIHFLFVCLFVCLLYPSRSCCTFIGSHCVVELSESSRHMH